MSLIRPSLKASESEGVVDDFVAAAAKLWRLAFQYGLSGRIFSIPSQFTPLGGGSFRIAIVISSAVSSSIPHRGGIWFSRMDGGGEPPNPDLCLH